MNKLTRGGSYQFGSSFSRSLDFFWRMLGIGLVQFCLMILFVGLAVLLIFVSPWTLLLTIPVFLAIIVPMFHVFELGRMALVARDTDVSSALAEGWELLKRNVGNVTIITLLYIALAIGFGIVYLIIGGIFFLPVGLAVAGITDQFWPTLIWAVVLGLPVSLVLGGFGGSFFHALYAQFYFQLLEPGPVQSVTTAGPGAPPIAESENPTLGREPADPPIILLTTITRVCILPTEVRRPTMRPGLVAHRFRPLEQPTHRRVVRSSMTRV